MSAHNIFRHALTAGIHFPQSELRDRETLISGSAKPFQSLSVVLRHNLAVLVQGTEKILRKGTALFSVFMKMRQMLGSEVAGSVMRSGSIINRSGDGGFRNRLHHEP